MKILFCLILSFLVYFAQADWFEDQLYPYPCSFPRYRRAWGDLSIDEKTLYARVVFQLWLHRGYWKIGDDSKTYSLYYILAAMHGDAENGMLHKTSAFPLHHKAYLWTYESAVIYTALVEGYKMDPPVTTEQACSIALPYWEWNLGFTRTGNGTSWSGNWDKIVETDIFRDPALFGDTSPELTTGNVDSGYFSPLTSGYGTDVNYPLRRRYEFAAFKSPSNNFDLNGWLSNPTSFGSFIQSIHGSLHGFIHTWVGNLMATTDYAGYDPIFYLHHANIDRFWHIWVDCRGWEFLDENALTETQYKALNPLSFGGEVQSSKKTKIAFKVGLDDKVNFYVDGVTAIFLPESSWPTLRELWSTGTSSRRGWNGLYYRYGPDKLVSANSLKRCTDQVWSLVNQQVPYY